MLIDHDIAQRHWRAAAEEQLERQYLGQGYVVKRETKIGDFRADLIASRGKELVVVEVKTGGEEAQKAKHVTQLRNYVVHHLGGQFKLVYVAPPREISVEIEEIDKILLGLVVDDPQGLNDLATHIHIEEVDGVEIEAVTINPSEILVTGSATVYLELQYGSDSDFDRGDGSRLNDSYPFTFRIAISGKLGLIRVDELEIDTSSFYE